MKLSAVIRKYPDWLIATTAILLVTVLALTAYTLLRDEKKSPFKEEVGHNLYEPKSGFAELVPPDKKYPAPGKEQAHFYKSYDAGDIQFNLAWTNRNVNRVPEFGPHVFTLELYNSRNNSVTIDAATAQNITVGCTAANKPYRNLSVSAKPQQFAPYETKKIDLAIDINCMYVGTADSRYFWRIY